MKMRKFYIVLLIVSISSLAFLVPTNDSNCQDSPDACPPAPTCLTEPDPLTPGYWKNHPGSWHYCFGPTAVPIDEINVCCESCVACGCTGCTTLTKEDAIAQLLLPVEGDKTYSMFDAVIAAKLNRLAGADYSCINMTINRAATWLCQHPLGSGVDASSAAWQQAEPWFEAIDNWNNNGCPATVP